MKWSAFGDSTIERFREHQRVSFEIQDSVKATLATGDTERDVARTLMKAY